MSDLRDIATLCKEIDTLMAEIKTLMAEVKTLRKERDEARREVCENLTDQTYMDGSKEICGSSARREAIARNWNCFGNTAGSSFVTFESAFHDKLLKDYAATNLKLKECIYERDEARMEICINEAVHFPNTIDPRLDAKRRGWDCFKNDTLWKEVFKLGEQQ